jgi:hypothetical protein
MSKESEPAPHSLSGHEVVSVLVAAYGRVDSRDESHGFGGVQDEVKRRKVERRNGRRRAVTASVLAGAVTALAAVLTLATD